MHTRVPAWIRVEAIILAFVFGLFLWGCGGGTPVTGGPSPTPTPSPTPVATAPAISSLSPATATAGGNDFTLTVNGANFVSASSVEVNGSARTTTFISSSELQIGITASDLVEGTVDSITVVNPASAGGSSTAFSFTINNPTPVVSGLSPTSVVAGSAAFTLTITGSGFVPDAVVQLNGNTLSAAPRARSTAVRAATFVFISGTELQVTVPAGDITAGSVSNIEVFNPAPGGGFSPPSSSSVFTINNPSPTVSSISPNSITEGGAAFTLTVNGTNFLNSSTVQLNGSARTTTFVSATQLQAAIGAADVANANLDSVTVVNPAPGGGTSGPSTLTVGNPTPTISSLSPNSVVAGTVFSTLPVIVNGTNFIPTSAVQINGTPQTTSVLSNTQIQIVLTAAQLATGGLDAVMVLNPSPGGGASAPSTFTINNPVPTLDLISPTSVTEGGASFVLSVLGFNFVSTSVIQLNGVAKPTVVLNSGEVQATLSAADVAAANLDSITVQNPGPGGGTTAAATLTITNPVPGVSFLSPNSVAAGSAAFTLTVNGSNFVPTSLVEYNGATRSTVFVSNTQLQATILASDVVTGGVVPISVFSPSPGGGLSKTSNFSIDNPVPTLTMISPTSVNAGGSAFTLTATGTNFVPGSLIELNGSSRSTSFISSTEVQATISSDDIANGALVNVTVLNPAPTGGATAPLTLTINNLVPTISLLRGSGAIVNSPGVSPLVGGSNFVPSSVVMFNGTPVPTTFIDAFKLTANIPASDLTSTGTFPVTVFNPTPGGGTSTTSVNFVVSPEPAPVIGTLDPVSGFVGGPAFTLTVTGSNFALNSVVQWNGSARPTTALFSNQLVAAITAADIASVGTASVTVMTPSPGGGTSSPLTFTISPNPVPAIAQLSPNLAVQGGPAFILTVSGSNFVTGSVVNWNGAPRTTTFVNSNQLTAAINLADLVTAGSAQVTVVTPSPGGGPSNALSFSIPNAAIEVDQATQDLVFDSLNQVIYLSVPSTASSNPNTISVIDLNGNIKASTSAGTDPNVLAISSDSQFLYAGIDGASLVQRFTLPALGTDISIPLGSNVLFGPNVALDIQVEPVIPQTTAVSIGNRGVSPSAQGGITIFDNAHPRTIVAPGGANLYDTIQWRNGFNIMAANNETSSADFYFLAVTSNGIVLDDDFQDVMTGGPRIHFDKGTGLAYTDGGRAVRPTTGLPAGDFAIEPPSIMIPDSTLNTAFSISAGPDPNTATIQSFDMTRFTNVGSVPVPNISGRPKRMIRYGATGLAFNTDADKVYLFTGALLAPPADPTPTPLPTPPPPTPTPTPTSTTPVITSVFPDLAFAGQTGVQTIISATNISASSVVQVNGSPRTTQLVLNGTALELTFADADIATPGVLSLTIANPAGSGGTSAPFTFFVGVGGQLTDLFASVVLDQPSNDLVYDPVHQLIYLSVPSTAANGNTITIVDLATASIGQSQFVGGDDPNKIAISDDGQFLYAALDGSSLVQRFLLPSLALDINYSLGTEGFFGPNLALDLQVAPGQPHTTAVSLGELTVIPSANGGLFIYDDATPRPTSAPGFGGTGNLFDTLQWGADATSLFAANNEDTGFDFYTLSVNTNGVSLLQDFRSVFDGTDAIHYDAGTNLIYTDGGHIINPASGTVVGPFMVGNTPFSSTGRMVPDSTVGRAFFVVPGTSANTLTVLSFSLTTLNNTASITIPNISGAPLRVIRWGQNGLAFNTTDGKVVIIGGNFVQ